VERKTDDRLERNFHLLADFQKQVEFLSRRRTIAVSDLEEELGKRGKREAPAAMITFDDGFANNLLAAEVLERARLPWSIFVTTGAIEDAGVLWPSEIALLLLHGNAGQVTAFDTAFSLRTRSEREQAYQVIRTRLKAAEASLRVRAIADLRAQFPSGETARLQECFPSMQMLRWSEVGQLSAGGVEVGSHGVSHELHHAAQSESVRMRELRDSKAELERRLSQECQAFAFPNGTYNGSSGDEVKRAGYRWAFTTQPRPAGGDPDCMLLPRYDPPASIGSFTRLFFNSRH
jgi:peptidoglycan/xylan/chitin deacetylase (PgdA/CDA1 family)